MTVESIVAPLDASSATTRRWLLLGFVLLGQFTIVASLGSINLALPAIRDELGASPTQLQWIVVIEQLTYAVLLMVGGRLGDVYGRRKLYLLGLCGFTLSSIIAGVASTASMVIAARLMQGIAGGVGSPQVLAMIQTIFNDRERPRAFSLFAMVSGGGFMAGQLGSGLLMRADLFGLGWRLPFVATAIGTTIALFGSAALLKNPVRGPRQYIDLPGCALSGVASIMLLYPMIQGRSAGWPPEYFAVMAGSLAMAWIFIRRQRRLSPLGRALIDVRLFSARSFQAGLGVSMMFALSAFAPFFLLSYTLQSGFGFDPLETALYTAGGPLMMIPASFIAPRVIRRIGRAVFWIGGGMSVLSTVAVFTILTHSSNGLQPLWLLPAVGLQGFGQGLFIPATTSLTMADVAPDRAGAASSIYQTAQQLIGSIGMAVFSVVFFGSLGTAVSAQRHVDAYTQVVPMMLFAAVGLCVAGFWAPVSALRAERSVRSPAA